MLGNAYIVGTEYYRFRKDVVSQTIKFVMYYSPCVAVVVTGKIAHVFKQCVFRMMIFQNPAYVKEQSSLCGIPESETVARF